VGQHGLDVALHRLVGVVAVDQHEVKRPVIAHDPGEAPRAAVYLHGTDLRALRRVRVERRDMIEIHGDRAVEPRPTSLNPAEELRRGWAVLGALDCHCESDDAVDVGVASALLERVTLHDLRHTYASFAIAAGVNVKALSEYMGHASIVMTMDRYGHLLPGNLANPHSMGFTP